MKRKKRKLPKYADRVIQSAEGLPPGAYVSNVFHDDWCAFFKGGECNCDPDVVVETSLEWIDRHERPGK